MMVVLVYPALWLIPGPDHGHQEAAGRDWWEWLGDNLGEFLMGFFCSSDGDTNCIFDGDITGYSPWIWDFLFPMMVPVTWWGYEFHDFLWWKMTHHNFVWWFTIDELLSMNHEWWYQWRDEDMNSMIFGGFFSSDGDMNWIWIPWFLWWKMTNHKYMWFYSPYI